MMMKSCYYENFGPANLVLKVGDLPIPKLEGPNDLIVKVHAASINPADYKQCEGGMKALMNRPFPVKPGFDFSGVIIEKGEKVDERLQVGDEVFGMIRGLRTGTTSEYIVVDEEIVSKKPTNVKHEDAAGVPLAAITAFQCLAKKLEYPPKEDSGSKSVFVSGGPGGVGTFVIQLAKKMFKVGRVVTTASSKEKADLCTSLGADLVIDYKKEKFEQVLDKQSFDICIDCTDEFSKMVSLVKENGVLASISGAVTKDMLSEWLGALGPHPGITIHSPIAGGIKILPQPVLNFFTGAWWTQHRLAKNAKYYNVITVPKHSVLDLIAKHLENGEIRVVIDKVFPLNEACEAYTRSMSGKAVGKIIVSVV